MGILEKLRRQPEHVRKIILWSVVILVGFVLLFFWVKNFSKRIKSFEEQNLLDLIKLPKFQEEIKKIELPKIPEEELKKIEEAIKEIPQSTPVK